MKSRFKKIISLFLVVIMAVTAMCVSAVSASADAPVYVTYKYIAKCATPIAAFDGLIGYPTSVLSIAQVYDEVNEKYVDDITVFSKDKPGYSSDNNGTIKFNATNYEEPYDFSAGAAVVTVKFLVTDPSSFEASYISTTMNEFYSQSQAQGTENTKYTYAEVADSDVIRGGSIDIDDPFFCTDNEKVYVTDSGDVVSCDSYFSRDAEDTVDFGFNEDFKKAQILGVQKKRADSNEKSVRFIAVLNNTIAQDADEYGFIAVANTTVDGARNVANAITLDNAPAKNIFNCKNTNNTVSGDYGKYGTDTTYKYVTYAVNNIGDNAVAVKFYIKKGNNIIYADYKNGEGNFFTYCAINWALLG